MPRHEKEIREMIEALTSQMGRLDALRTDLLDMRAGLMWALGEESVADDYLDYVRRRYRGGPLVGEDG